MNFLLKILRLFSSKRDKETIDDLISEKSKLRIELKEVYEKMENSNRRMTKEIEELTEKKRREDPDFDDKFEAFRKRINPK